MNVGDSAPSPGHCSEINRDWFNWADLCYSGSSSGVTSCSFMDAQPGTVLASPWRADRYQTIYTLFDGLSHAAWI
jgi:hypothetical protein